MKAKKFPTIMLIIVLALTCVFASGCSKNGNNDESETSGIVTLNMFVITEQETSPDAARAVQMAINEITVPQNKMLVKINYLTKDEYWDAVGAAEEAVKNYKAPEKAASSEEEDEKKTIDKMSFNEAIDYVFEIDDIELTRPQIDILVVDEYDKFVELVNDGRLAEIDIKYDRKALTKYIHPTVFATTTVNKKTYGIPANFGMQGEYEFLVFNKNLLDKYGYTVHDLRKIEDMGGYLRAIKNGESGVYPISDIPELSGAEIYDGILYTLSDFTSVSDNAFPVYLNNAGYVNYLNTVSQYRKNGYVASYDGVKNTKYAIEYRKTEDLLEHEWTDEDGTTYQAYLYDIPRVETSSAFKSAMCVSAYSANRSKAAELIELFNLDPELANLLQYGIEGKNYRAEDGIVTLIDTSPEDTYRMNNFLTGNTYIKYTAEEDADYVEKAKAANLSTAPSAFFGFNLSFDDVASESVYDCVKRFSTTALEKIANGEMTVDEAFNIANRQLIALGCRWNDSGTALLGVFGTLAADQKASAKANTSSFKLSKDVETYNDVYMSSEELAEEEAEREALEAELEAEKAAEREAELEALIEAENAAADAEGEQTEETTADGEASEE